MLKSLYLENFRGFSEHRVTFGPETILIGQNNAGKTTVIEALRVISVVQARALTTSFVPCPPWLDGICQGAGFRPSLEPIDFDFANVHHSYQTDRPAILKAKLRNNNEIHIYIGQGANEVFCQLRRGPSIIVHSKVDITPKTFGSIKVMPPVGSLLRHEKIISKDRMNRYQDGYLAYRHFRNQMFEKPSEFATFKRLLEDTWSNLKIEHFENDHGEERNEYSLLVREGRFASEISWHGHGLQAWMQTIWFLARTSCEATVVLDEPDVYLHADLQRKLIKVVEGLGFKQSIIATHSPEIISDVPFQGIVVVQKRLANSKPAQNAVQIQQALRSMGSIHSLQLSKLAERGRVLIVEGDDRRFLVDVAYKLGPKVFDRFSALAVMELGGKGNWQHALGAANALADASGGTIATTLVLDSDYMLDHQKDDALSKSKTNKLDLHIWRKKEIENYFISISAISRYISQRCEEQTNVIESWVSDEISSIELELREDAILSYSDVIQRQSSPKIDTKKSFSRAKEVIEDRLKNGKLRDLISGKLVFSKLSDRSKKKYDVSFSPLAICKETRISELPNEMKQFVENLCANNRS